MTSSPTEGQGPTASLRPSDLILRIKRPRYEDLYPCPPPQTGKFLTRAALDYRPTIMSYDYMVGRADEYDNPNSTWTRMLADKPRLGPMCFQFQRGRGKVPKVVDCYAIGDQGLQEAIGLRLLDLATGRRKTALPHYFDRTVKGRNPREDVVGWLDLRNGIYWTTDVDQWRNVARFLGDDYPCRYVHPKFTKTFIITRSNETPALPAPVTVPGLCSPEASAVALPAPQL